MSSTPSNCSEINDATSIYKKGRQKIPNIFINGNDENLMELRENCSQGCEVSFNQNSGFAGNSCGENLDDELDLTQFIGTGLRKNSYSCSICHVTFSRCNSLYKHMRRTHELYYYGNQFDSLHDLNTTPEAKDQVVDCDGYCMTSGAIVNFAERGSFLVGDGYPNFNTEKSSALVGDLENYEDYVELSERSKWKKEDVELLQYMTIRPGYKRYECLTCGKQFHFKTEMRRHLRVHTGERPHSCPLCQKRFGRRYNLHVHLKLVHKFTRAEIEGVKKNMAQTTQSVPHPPMDRNCSGVDQDRRVCKYNRTFQQLSDPNGFKASEEETGFVKYVKFESGYKHYECDICFKRFHDKTDFGRHRRAHYGVKPYNCSLCQQKFSRSNSLYKHMRRMHKLYYCSKEFNFTSDASVSTADGPPDRPVGYIEEIVVDSSLENLIDSITTSEARNFNDDHSDCPGDAITMNASREHNLDGDRQPNCVENLYQCQLCGKKLRYKSDMGRHLRTHTGEKPFSCYMCDRKFARASNLQRHIKNIHVDENNSE